MSYHCSLQTNAHARAHTHTGTQIQSVIRSHEHTNGTGMIHKHLSEGNYRWLLQWYILVRSKQPNYFNFIFPFASKHIKQDK